MEERLSHSDKIRLTGIRKFGSEQAWREAQAERGRAGGQAKVPKGFAVLPTEQVKQMSTKGLTSRWKK